MKCLVTICSKKKDESPELLPAHLRYLAPHIEDTYKKSKELNIPFYILSGKYGLISSDEKIPFYDYYLESDKVDNLSDILVKQIKELGITEIDFYIEEKGTWEPYISALEKASIKTECILNKEKLFPDFSELKIK